jgi:hypothetical protein
VNTYDPDVSPSPAKWLQLDEAERLELVARYHQSKQIRLPNAELHAVIHIVVENQVALGEEVVTRTLVRLGSEGLGRHEAIHAVGSVLAEHLYDLLHERSGINDDVYTRYIEGLENLTAATWRAQGA